MALIITDGLEEVCKWKWNFISKSLLLSKNNDQHPTKHLLGWETKKSNKCFLVGGFIFSGNPEAACEGYFFQTWRTPPSELCNASRILQVDWSRIYQTKSHNIASVFPGCYWAFSQKRAPINAIAQPLILEILSRNIGNFLFQSTFGHA